MSQEFIAIPTLVIGLGGTGLKVATYIKKSLLEANQNQLPKGMGFLVLDTEKDIKFQAGGWGQARGPNHATGPVKIDFGEYYGLTGNVRSKGEDIKKEQIEAEENPSARRGQSYRHINTWFAAKYYIDEANIPPLVWNLDIGAGRYRQFGRLALFNHIQWVIDKLRNVIRVIKRESNQNQGLQIHIVGSLAGGTGASLFLDVAHLAGQIAIDLISNAPVIRGHFVLSEGFEGTLGTEFSAAKNIFNARCYAALRELSRLQGPIAKKEWYGFMYDPRGKGPMNATLKNSPYSTVYLYDGKGSRNPLNETTIENGLAPAIADAIVPYIDDLSGGAFGSRKVNEISNSEGYNISSGAVTFGSIGTYTIEMPIYHITEGWSHQLALDVLTTLLAPAAQDETTKTPTALMTNQPGGKKVDPEAEARKWVRDNITALVSDLVQWGERANGSNQLRQEVIEEILSRDATIWQQRLAPSDPQFNSYVTDAQAELEGSLTDKKSYKYFVDHGKVSGNSTAQKADNLLTEVDEKLKLMVGRIEGWKRDGGDFRRALVRLGNHHVQEFENGLLHWLKLNLNGSETGNEIERKGGKLGFAIAFLASLKGALQASREVLGEAENKSDAKRRPMYNAIDEERKELAAKMRNSSGLFGGNLKAYRDKSNELAQFHKADIARQIVRDLIVRLYQLVEQLWQELRLWEQVLAKATGSYGGTYALVQNGLTEVKTDRARSKNKVRWVIDDDEPNDTYLKDKHRQYAEDQLEAVLSKIEWQVGRLDGSRDLRIEFTFAGQQWSRAAGKAQGQSAGLKNSHSLLEVCRGVFAKAWDDISVVAYLKKKFLTDGDTVVELADMVHKNSDYLLSRVSPTTPPPMRGTYLRVRQVGLDPGDINFLQHLTLQVSTKFNEVAPSSDPKEGRTNEGVVTQNSRDPFKLTFVLFGDLLQPEVIAGFVAAQQQYRAVTAGGNIWQEVHILPAETHALAIEKDLEKGTEGVRQKRREFDEQVVAVLEDMERFQLAMRCWVYGESDYAWGTGAQTGLLLHLYTPQASNPNGQRYWRLTVAPDDYDSNLEHYQLTPLSANPELLEAFIQFVGLGKDQKDGRQINWQRVERTIAKAMSRHLEIWQGMDMGWRPKEPRFRPEGEDKAAQFIRLNAQLAEIDRELKSDSYFWAWDPGNTAIPQKYQDRKESLQREVDLYTALRGVIVQAQANLTNRLDQLGTWSKTKPSEKVVLSPNRTTKQKPEPNLAGWLCPKCQQQNEPEDRFCSNCRTPQPEPTPPIQPKVEPSIASAASIVCENGHPLQPEWSVCPICGKGPQQLGGVCENDHPMNAGWILCPICGRGPKQQTATKIVCENDHPMNAGWILCPICGRGPKQQTATKIVCENGHEMQPNWKLCPNCGKSPK